MADLWAITPKERERFEMQFRGLNPINGVITGDQAKGFLLQSQLPPPTLGQIWGLADRDADGKMDIAEFSIACKLIMMKLRGIEVPKVLPPALLTPVGTPAAPVGTPPVVPPPPKLAAATPPAIIPMQQPPPVIPMQPVMQQQPPPVVPMQPPMVPPAPMVAHPQMMQAMATQPQMMQQQMMPGMVPMVAPGQPMVQMMPQVMPQVAMMQPGMQMAPQVVQAAHPPVLPAQPSLGTPPMMSPPMAEPQMVQMMPPAIPPPAAEMVKQRSASVASVELGSPLDWSVPHQSKLRYTQVFNSNDRTRCGHLTGAQARNILIQWRLPQAILAQIWAMSDLDSDGRLSCEEFVLAMHLCELASKGDKIPAVLPPDLIPPSFRRSRVGSLKSVSGISVVSGTATPPGMQSGPGSVDGDLGSPTSQSSFEDKRKKNYEKGQAELERRRKALLEVQRKEQEERERKEREEHDKREKLRLEQERKRQEEIEQQLMMQRELEEKQEEERLRAQEQKEAARKESERQRQLDWEKQRSQELQQQRQKEQERVLQLKAQSQSLSVELSQRNEKVRELSQKISETRAAVATVKTTIDGMRATRDEQMTQMSSLKAKLREQNQRLVVLSQEKLRMDARNKANTGVDGADFSHVVNNKQVLLKQLQDQIDEQEKVNNLKKQDVKNNNATLAELKRTLKGLIDNCESSYEQFEDKRQKVCIMKNRIVDDLNAQWGDSGSTNWGSQESSQNNWNNNSSWSAPQAVEATPVEAVPGMTRYRALFEFVARNGDELSFQPGDVILVPDDHNAEPGWLAGKIRDSTGWFPESYVERIDAEAVSNGAVAAVEAEERKPLEGIAEVPETTSDTGSLDSGPAVSDPVTTPVLGTGQTMPNVFARTLYSFKGKKDSYLSFSKGEVITLHEQQDQWSYGEVNGQQGWFPNSYVKIEEAQPATDAGEYYMAMYPYDSAESGDLNFGQGEMILVTKKDGDWWTGTIDGQRTGVFPGSYVSKVEAQESTAAAAAPVVDINAAAAAAAEETQAEKSALHDEVKQIIEQQKSFKEKTESVTTPDSLGSKSPLPQGKGKKPEIAQVLAPYKATSTEQLSLNRGQLVMVRKKTSTGWWEGELQAKGKKRQVGWFPASYVKLLVSSGTASGRTTPTARFRETPSPMPGKDRVIAMYSYVAQNSDELSFDKDEVITVLSRDDPSWWKGELQGATGLFPSNYVSAIPTENSEVRSSDRARQGSIAELIETEQSYINDMTVVTEAFEKPLREAQIISREDVDKIFVNWMDILQCNYVFLRALRVRRDMSPGGEIRMIGDILCEVLPRMAAYARFFSCQLRAADLLQFHTENTPEFRQFVKQCEMNPMSKGLPLSSFLIKPMQRITKYPLLVKKILENTPEDHPDHQNLQEALASAEEFCVLVNEGVREREDSDRLEWLQKHIQYDHLDEQLIFNSLTNMLGPRKFIHYGVLKKVNSGRELVAFLLNDFLMLTCPSKPLKGTTFSFDKYKGNSLKIYKKPFFLNEIKFSAGNENEEMVLQDESRSYLLHAPTSSERSLWLRHLSETKRIFLEKESSFLQRQQSKKNKFGAIGRVMICVVEADGLAAVRNRHPKGSVKILKVNAKDISDPLTNAPAKCDVFCEVSMGSQERRTLVATGPHPRWNSNMQFLVKDLNEDVLCFTVFSKGHFAPNEFLGRAEVRIKDIPFDPTTAATGPYVKNLRLREVQSGTLSIKLDLRLFEASDIPTHRQRLI